MTIIWKQTRVSKLAVSLHYWARTFRLYEAWLRHGHRKARAAYRDQWQWLSSDHRLDDLCQELRARGIAQRHLDYFDVPYKAMVNAADQLCAELAVQPIEGDHYRDVPDDARLLAEPEPYLFVLSKPLLDLAERYIGLPVRYFGVSVKREIANGVLAGTRGWHTDPEDENVLKIIVYLNDVDAGTGPFQCFTGPDTIETQRVKNLVNLEYGYVCEGFEQTKRTIHPVTCLGPRLTANICDTARCLHRASPPTTTDRYSITFSYLSERPYLLWDFDLARQRQFLERWGSLLNTRQTMALR